MTYYHSYHAECATKYKTVISYLYNSTSQYDDNLHQLFFWPVLSFQLHILLATSTCEMK